VSPRNILPPPIGGLWGGPAPMDAPDGGCECMANRIYQSHCTRFTLRVSEADLRMTRMWFLLCRDRPPGRGPTWECHKCTFHNDPNAPQCEMCHTQYVSSSRIL
jgi:hypothetical protein